MTDELLERYIQQLIESHRAPDPDRLAGGRAYAHGLEFFRMAVELSKKNARPGMTVMHTIQIIGTKINGDWARFSRRTASSSVSASTGRASSPDAYRRDKGGKPTFDKVMRGLAALRSTASSGTRSPR